MMQRNFSAVDSIWYIHFIHSIAPLLCWIVVVLGSFGILMENRLLFVF